MFFSCFCLHESLYFSRCCPVVELLTGSVVFEIPNRPCVLWRANSFRGGSENSGVSGSKCHSDLQPRCRPSPVTCCCLEALKLLPTPWGFASFSSNPFGKKRPRDQVIFLPVTLTAPQITAVFFSYDAFVLTCFNPRHVMILVDFVMILWWFSHIFSPVPRFFAARRWFVGFGDPRMIRTHGHGHGRKVTMGSWPTTILVL